MWSCRRCSARNEAFRNWCRKCNGTRDEALGTSAWQPAAAGPTPKAPPPEGRVRPLAVVAVLAVVALVGAGAFVLLRPADSAKASTAAPDPRTPEQIWADALSAQAVQLTLADFPAGWHSKPRSDEPHDADEEQAIASFGSCLGGGDDEMLSGQTDVPGAAKSDDFEADTGDLSAEAYVYVRPSVQTAQQELSDLGRPQTASCFGQLIDAVVRHAIDHPKPGKELPEGVSFLPAIAGMTDLPGVHADTIAVRITVPVTGPRGSITEVFEFAFAQRARTELMLVLFNVNEAFPDDLAVQLINAMADRTPST